MKSTIQQPNYGNRAPPAVADSDLQISKGGRGGGGDGHPDPEISERGGRSQ